VTSARYYLEAARAARGRQLRARALRPLRRRSFPGARTAGPAVPLDVGLWSTDAFAGCDEVAGEQAVRLLGAEVPFPPLDWSLAGEPRLRRFHLHYGEEVLGWARRGDVTSAAAALTAWIDGNPPRRSDAWHPYPLSTRVGNWVAALSIAPELATAVVSESLARQLAHLERNVEDDVLGNHVVRNARGLVLGGTSLGLPEPVERGLALLERELPEQILSDGGHYERSPVYHLIVLRDLLEVRSVTCAEWLDLRIERMTEFAAALTRPDGRPALFNDGALDLAPSLELPEPPDGMVLFPDTGYIVIREGGVWLAFDCGPPAPDFLPAHAHADALSFQLWVDGCPLVIDPGTFTYEPGVDREWFRSTPAHSTIGLGGRDHFEHWSAFRAVGIPRPRLVSTDPLAAEVRLGEVTYRRRLTLGPQELVIEDELEGSGEVDVRSSLPVAAEVDVEPIGPLAVSSQAGWASERMFQRAPITVIRCEGRLRLPVRLGWRIGLRSNR